MRFLLRLFKYFLVFNGLAVLSAMLVRQLVESEGDEDSDEFTLATVMMGNQFTSRAQELSSARIVTYMGGAEIDLTEAVLSDDAAMNLLTVMGGVEVRVPPHWRVDVRTEVLIGECSLDLDDQDELPDTAPLLRVDARTIAGGLVITNKPRRTTAPTP